MTRVQIGNFPPKAEAVLTVFYNQNLDIDDYSYRLTVPTTYIPKYLGDICQYLNGGSNFKVSEGHESEQQNDEDVEMINEEIKESEIERIR